VFFLDAHVGAREERGGEADEGGERDQEDVEGVDEELVVEDEDGAVAGDADGEQCGGDERGEADGDVEVRGVLLCAKAASSRKPTMGRVRTARSSMNVLLGRA
jgi:hypothetical protein